MTQPIRTTICILADSTNGEYFPRCLDSVLRHTPLADIEIRLGFGSVPHAFHYALGVMCADGASPDRNELPGRIERFSWTGATGLKVRAWLSSSGVARDGMARLLYYDPPLDSDYVVTLIGTSWVEPGWWEALVPQMEQGVEYLGPLAWQDYSPAQMEGVRTQTWYMGVPFNRREGRQGVWFVPWGFMAARSERIREADFPKLRSNASGDPAQKCNDDVQLGEIARQLGWKHVNHRAQVQVKAG